MPGSEATDAGRGSSELPPIRVGAPDQRPSQRATPNVWIGRRLASERTKSLAPRLGLTPGDAEESDDTDE